MYCKHCGKEIADDSKFCQHCGSYLSEQKTDFIADTCSSSTDAFRNHDDTDANNLSRDSIQDDLDNVIKASEDNHPRRTKILGIIGGIIVFGVLGSIVVAILAFFVVLLYALLPPIFASIVTCILLGCFAYPLGCKISSIIKRRNDKSLL